MLPNCSGNGKNPYQVMNINPAIRFAIQKMVVAFVSFSAKRIFHIKKAYKKSITVEPITQSQ